jgi:hypothetical protein
MKAKNIIKFISNCPIALVVIVLSLFISSCSRDDGPPPPPIPEPEPATVKFSATSLNVEENATAALTVDLSFSKPLREAGTVTISLDDASTASTSDYSTTPSSSEGTIVFNLAQGASAASFSVTPVDNMDLNDNKTIIFNISAAEGGVKLADSDLTLTITITNDDEEDGGGEPSGLIFNDNFDYGTTAENLTAVSSWERYSGELNPIQYIVDGLSFEGYGSSAIGGAITFEGGAGSREDVQIQFESQNSGTIYLAQIINLSSAEATASGDFFLSLRDPDDGFFNRLYAKDNGSGKLLLGTARTRSGGGSEVFSTTEYSYNTNYLVVLKYDFDTKLASMFVIGDSVPATEPATPDVVADTGAEPASLEEIVIRQGSSVIVGTIDGIRVGTTWEEALGLE